MKKLPCFSGQKLAKNHKNSPQKKFVILAVNYVLKSPKMPIFFLLHENSVSRGKLAKSAFFVIFTVVKSVKSSVYCTCKKALFLSASFSCSRFYFFKFLFLFFRDLSNWNNFILLEQFYSFGTILFFWNNFILLE